LSVHASVKSLVAFLLSLGNFLFFLSLSRFFLGFFLLILFFTHNFDLQGTSTSLLCTFYSDFHYEKRAAKCVILSKIRVRSSGMALGNGYNCALVTPTASNSLKESTGNDHSK
jgi:hypothetical protein